jgi:hypothetical protein
MSYKVKNSKAAKALRTHLALLGFSAVDVSGKKDCAHKFLWKGKTAFQAKYLGRSMEIDCYPFLRTRVGMTRTEKVRTAKQAVEFVELALAVHDFPGDG